MAYLPLANLMHHKLRSALSAAGIGIGICMLLTLSGLSRGSLNEVADRWETVDADLIVYPRGWGNNVTTLSGIGLSDRYAQRVREEYGRLVAEAVPVFLWQMRLAEQDHMAVGVDPGQWHVLTGGRTLSAGRLFDPNGAFSAWLERKLQSPADDEEAIEITSEELRARGGLELVIDDRLAAKGRLRVNDEVNTANHRWRIVGIVPSGAMARVFMPRRTAQFLFGSGSLAKSTLMFVKLKDGLDLNDAARQLGGMGQEVIQLRQYRTMLRQKFSIMYYYVDAVNAVAMIIAFLFIMVTLYTMVLQRTREIAMLKSFGASAGYILRGVLAESMIMTAAGTAVGLALSLVAGWLIQSMTLYTVTITWEWIAVAVAAAAIGALAAGLYPAWRAIRVDMVQALTFE
ncbi:MAG TPA: ABC transporter permease [Phycisphaerae bacterium]|nr:ABC transporter permease [Phycisphaerae bacterium]HUT56765.1 ABC transporter permease [Phycisphaerae bacterium]